MSVSHWLDVMAEIITVAVIAADANHIAYVATVNQREGVSGTTSCSGFAVMTAISSVIGSVVVGDSVSGMTTGPSSSTMATS